MITPEQELALALSKDLQPSANQIERVARQTSPLSAQWAFQQWQLRARAATKFDRADGMLFDRDGLEMATTLSLARYHASKFPEGALVVDMTTGLGSDLIALAERGPVIGVDLDPIRLQFAEHNLAQYGLTAEFILGDSLEALALLKERGIRHAFCDPARRSASGRSLDANSFSPDPLRALELFAGMDVCGLKLSPMLSDSFLEGCGGRLEFISAGAECREALVWSGVETARVAVQPETNSVLEAGSAIPPPVKEPAEFLFEADPAAIRAHALGSLCNSLNLLPLADSNGYLTGDQALSSPWLRGYEVIGNLKGDLKETRKRLRHHGAGTPIVKSRAGIDVDQLRRALKGDGEELVVAAYPDGKSVRHAILRPLVS